MVIGGNTLPSAYDGIATSYNYNREILGYNGENDPIYANEAFLEWKIDRLEKAGMDWWIDTLLADGNSYTFNSITLYTAPSATSTFGHCKVLKPTYERFDGYDYINVVISIVDIY